MQISATLHITNNDPDTIIFDPEEVLEILHLTSLGYYRIKQGILQQNLSKYDHHVVPSTFSRLAVMDLHSTQSLALHTNSPYFSPVQSLMLSIHIILALPHPLFLSISPSSNNLCIPFCLIKCPKYWSFLFFIVTISDLLEIVISITSLLLCTVHDILIIHLHTHISNASSLF